jgi:hypothetical protein
MSPAYIQQGVQREPPHALIVFDHFQVHWMANSMVEDLRRHLLNLFP